MKAVTEFANFTLSKALETHKQLAAEGKSPEDIQTSLGETYKLEGEKLGFFVKALEVAGAKPENLKRVIIMRLNEGEAAPAKSTQVEDIAYVPEYHVDPKARAAAMKAADDAKKGGRNGRGGGRGNDRGGGGKGKESPWGLSPEEKANKNKPASKPGV